MVALPGGALSVELTFRWADDVGLASHEMLTWCVGLDCVVVVGRWILQEWVDPVVE